MLSLNIKELQWIYKTLQNARLEDNYDITCQHCPMPDDTCIFCDNVMYKIRIQMCNMEDS